MAKAPASNGDTDDLGARLQSLQDNLKQLQIEQRRWSKNEGFHDLILTHLQETLDFLIVLESRLSQSGALREDDSKH